MTLSLHDRRAALKAQLTTLVAGANLSFDPPIFVGAVLDETKLPRDESGKVGSYFVIRVGRPIPTSGDRAMAAGEESQPHIVPWTIAAFGGNPDQVAQCSDVLSKLIGFKFDNDDDSTPLKGAGGYTYTATDAESRPSRVEEASFFTCIINLTS